MKNKAKSARQWVYFTLLQDIKLMITFFFFSRIYYVIFYSSKTQQDFLPAKSIIRKCKLEKDKVHVYDLYVQYNLLSLPLFKHCPSTC